MGLFSSGGKSGAPRKKLQKNASRTASVNDASQMKTKAPATNCIIGPSENWNFDFSTRGTTDKQTGERRDITGMLHSFGIHGLDDDSDAVTPVLEDAKRQPGEPRILSLGAQLWKKIVSFLSPADAASLAFASKPLLALVGSAPWDALALPGNERYRLDFLMSVEDCMPNHLFCFPCQKYHIRINPGQERLKTSNFILNPLFACPHAQNARLIPPKTRIAPGHSLPFTFVQLATKAARYGPEFGLSCEKLARRWANAESGWSHQTRYLVVKGHLLMRVTSQTFAPGGLTQSGMRLLLYSREDYTPYFSVCAHWRDGDLMDTCKCALSHIQKPADRTNAKEMTKASLRKLDMLPSSAHRLASMCGSCQPMRRCPECPSEYLVELKLAEDKGDPVNRFKQAIVITRWCGLGDGSSPDSSEWAAVNGEDVGYDSFAAIGRRAISGVFESQINDTGPGQRIVSMNPKKEKKGEAGNNWY